MTHRGGKEGSERRRGIGENEKAADDGIIGHSMEVFQLSEIDNA